MYAASSRSARTGMVERFFQEGALYRGNVNFSSLVIYSIPSAGSLPVVSFLPFADHSDKSPLTM